VIAKPPSTRARRQIGAAPFLKWAGGKSQLLADILSRLPLQIEGTYFEPFIGGGAVFFELARQKRIRYARLSDRNAELVTTYKAIRDGVEGVIKALAAHKNDEAHYYEVRAVDPATLTPAQCAARTIFLNRVGYNGLYRVNSRGLFNVPFGRYRNPKICDPDALRRVSQSLQIADIVVADFEESCARAVAGDVVYLDPPYVPVSKTASFTSYSGRFDEKEHQRLAETFARLVDAGAFVLLSNSDTELSRSLYAGFKIDTVNATRAINSRADRRGVVREVLVQGLRLPVRRPRAYAHG
jgi:DNA adenine methylase